MLELFNNAATANLIAFIALLVSGYQAYSTWKCQKSNDIVEKEKERKRQIDSIENNLETLVIVYDTNLSIARYKAEKISEEIREFCRKYQLRFIKIQNHYSIIFNYVTNDGLDRDELFEPLTAIRDLIKILRE